MLVNALPCLQDAQVRPLSILRRQIFIIRINGIYADDTPVTVHAESGSTVKSVVQQVGGEVVC